MKTLIDTCSLLALIRYYLAFDNDNTLFDFIKEKIERKEIIIIDKVFEECRYTSKGIVLEKLQYLKDNKGNIEKTNSILPPGKKFYNQLENQFTNNKNPKVKKLREEEKEEWESRKQKFLNDADCKLILYSLLKKEEEEITIVTEETRSNNDNKCFKKISEICKILKLKCKTLPQLLESYNEIKIEYSKRIKINL